MSDAQISSDAAELRGDEILDALPHLFLTRVGRASHFYGNRAWCQHTGLPKSERFGPEWIEHIHTDDRIGVLSRFVERRDSDEPAPLRCRVRNVDGAYKWFAVNSGVISSLDATFLSFTEITKHVVSYQELEAKSDLQTSMLDASADCIKLIRPDGVLLQLNRSGCVALGVPANPWQLRVKWLDRLPKQVRARGRRALREACRGKSARFPGMSELPGERAQYWDNMLTPVMSPQGKTAAILCVSRDITLQHVAEERLRSASEIDSLTGLWNRRVFRKRLQCLVAKARQTRGHLALLLIDLDHFKHVNDTLGHHAGDHLLRVLSKRLKMGVPSGALVARLGGDEFAIILPGIADDEALQDVAWHIIAQARAPVSYSGKAINGGMSVGCALYPRDGDNSSLLMRHADTALNHLKLSGGRGGVQIFNSAMLEHITLAASQLCLAREIVKGNRIVAHYQPKVRLDSRALVGFEALMRWQRHDGTLGFPNTVAEAFRDYELATGIADAMHSSVLGDMARWINAGRCVLPIAINASPVEFYRDDYAERLLGKLDHFGVPPHLVEIEITEHMLIERGNDFTFRAIAKMKKAGLRIALDDFGTGYSSFGHLRDYPIDVLKIDRSFVRGMENDGAILAIVEAACLLGARLSLDVVAEGVESEADATALRRAGCAFGQGFYFGAPIHANQVWTLLSTDQVCVAAANTNTKRAALAESRRRSERHSNQRFKE